MPSTVSTPIGVRIPNEHLAALRAQAARYGLSTSSAVAALVAGALAVEQQDAEEPAEDVETR